MHIFRIVRSFSTAPVTRQLTKPPVQVFGLEGRYATALYSAAFKEKSLDTVEKDLTKFQELVKMDKKLSEFINDPSIKRKDKSEALKAIGQKIKMHSTTTNTLALLAENGRLKKLNQLINLYKLIMAGSRGEVVCEVITAKPLDSDMQNKLQTTLKGFVGKGGNVLLTTKVDPSIIGGMIVSIGDKYVDMSVASKIKKYTDIISQSA